jgi:hypothetical protein
VLRIMLLDLASDIGSALFFIALIALLYGLQQLF